MTDNLAVLRAGEIVEMGRTGTMLNAPQHEYTRALIAAGLTAPQRREGRT